MPEIEAGWISDDDLKKVRITFIDEPECLDAMLIQVLTRRHWWQFWRKPKVEWHTWGSVEE